MILEIDSYSLDVLFDKMPPVFKYEEHSDCYWELYKADCDGTRYFIRLFTETPHVEIKRFDNKKLTDVLKDTLKWIKTNTSSPLNWK